MDEVEHLFLQISKSLSPEGVREGLWYLKLWKKLKSLHPTICIPGGSHERKNSAKTRYPRNPGPNRSAWKAWIEGSQSVAKRQEATYSPTICVASIKTNGFTGYGNLQLRGRRGRPRGQYVGKRGFRAAAGEKISRSLPALKLTWSSVFQSLWLKGTVRPDSISLRVVSLDRP